MKKTVSLALAALFLSGSFIFSLEASRDVYHAYSFAKKRLNSPQKRTVGKYRYFSNRVYAFSQSKRRRSLPTKEVVTNKYASQNPSEYLRVRKETARWEKKMRRVRIAKNIGGDMNIMETFENDRFSIAMPNGWNPVEGKSHFFRNPFSRQFTVAIKYIETDCRNTGFTACAIDIAKSENRNNSLGRLFPTDKIERQAREKNTILNAPDKTSTLTESFTATTNGDNEFFISRYFVQDSEGGVFVIETQSDARVAKNFVFVSKRIFDSFRMFDFIREEV